MAVYEKHTYLNPSYPFSFQRQKIGAAPYRPRPHWHEDVEILYMLSGSAVILSGLDQIKVESGQFAVVNSGETHAVYSGLCELYCLIVSKKFCEEFGVAVDSIVFQTVVRDESCREYLLQIAREVFADHPFKSAQIKGTTILLLTRLARLYSCAKSRTPAHRPENKKNEIVKASMEYISANFRSPILIDDICAHIGYSKYYFCHLFKEITGSTVVDYINGLRCEHARKLIASGQYNISESAEMSGFNNVSFFSKVYRKCFGILPSQTPANT